ncbi:bifunctional 3-oxoadipate enol-lactonase/4-carboxymuconolactone decarboxylase PcaDC [Microtetraspora niveoalba]|uniref:bifunctional 3-oxoadipate enol-lactonase/4-carboxymuconolactone decarboxylase PcaDC n=1 Tax=Microtetraspora niveoalba TaxID=46175 RepID=UPI00082E714D|nr:3-oxoadipate enol-lactonase [Microtetraspora niveoalba]
MKPDHTPGTAGGAAPSAAARPHHRVDGPRDAPALVLGPSLGTSLTVWDPQVPALARDHRVLRWDLPGHGGSPALLSEGATVADLAGLVLDLADDLGVDRFHYAGISLGGAVGAWLALHHPDRVASLAMVCSSAWFGPAEGWRERAALVRAKGAGVMAESAAQRWFTPAFDGAAPFLDDLREVAADGYAACCDALAAYDIRAELGRIGVPTLVIGGRDDPATPPAHARELADGIPGATLVEIPGAAHLASVERPEPVLSALLTHLADGGDDGHRRGDGSRRYAAGMGVRRAVLGDAHVDRATANADAFTADFQDFITRYAWGEIWTRPGLDRRTRSCVTITALVARGHLDELAMHIRAALRNGLTPDEIKEVLLQTAVYCGVPAANSAFAVAQRTLRELQERNP